jgi:diguanylate cyclase (GGDEF)-like protein
MLEVKRLSTIDPLTQLYNRRGLEKAIQAKVAQKRRHDSYFSVAMLDLDGFKGLNDSMGHGVGDKALTLFAAIAHSHFRQTDLIFRMGGDEFLILMPNTKASDCEVLCNALCHAACTKLTEALSYPMSTSIGFTTAEHVIDISAEEFNAILSIADDALYRAKELGKGGVVRGYAEELTEKKLSE